MKQINVTKEQIFTCDFCGHHETMTTDTNTWITILETETNDLRLFEKKNDNYKYESFHIPNKQEKNFCTTTCALEYLKKSVELFVASLKPSTRVTKFKPFK